MRKVLLIEGDNENESTSKQSINLVRMDEFIFIEAWGPAYTFNANLEGYSSDLEPTNDT